MDVDGISVAKALEIENASIVEGEVNGSGFLVLTNKGGTEFNAGLVVPPAISSWPVGCIFITVSTDSPALLLGGGTWERFAKGRTLVSLDESQTEFDGLEEVGGEKTHLLTPAELPRHSHGYNAPGTGVDVAAGAGQFPNTGSSFENTFENPTDPPNDPDDQPHNNLQPYINVYMWKRTA